MIEKFTPNPSQLDRLSDEEYAEISAITIAKLQAVESSLDIPDISSLTEAEIEAWLLEQQTKLERDIEADVAGLIDERTPLKDFEREIADLVVSAALVALLFAVGGLSSLRSKQSARAFVRQANRTINDNITGLRRATDRIANRELTVKQIGQAGRRRGLSVQQGFSRSELLNNIATRFHNEGMRTLGSSHPCPDCPLYVTGGYVAIEEIVPIATACVCGLHCKCRITTRFNPQRALDELTNDSIIDRVNRYESSLEQTQAEYLSRHGWL